MKYILLFSFLLTGFLAVAQNDRDNGSITGIILDSTTQKPLPGATIEIISTNVNSHAAYKGNAISDLNGKFTVKNIPAINKPQITITAIGYGTQVIHSTLTTADLHGTKNIGTIHLAQQTNTLGTVVVTASAPPAMQFGIDRKIFNVEQNITAQGGTAVDVMKNIPSLTVDVDGNVEMRNSSPQILIDGRPTILTLDQIPADDIERVELITNPSAKYDASSAGGIINIVLKKNKRFGLNGIASIGVGAPSVLTGNLSMNLSEEKFNFFASGNYNKSGGNSKEETYRINKDDGIPTSYFTQSSDNARNRRFTSVRFGLDYFLDDKNTISFTQGFHNGHFGNNESQNQQYFDAENILAYTGYRVTNGLGTFNRSRSRLSFERQLNINDPGNKLTADITYTKGGNSDNDFIVNDFYNPDGSIYSPQTKVSDKGSGDNYQVTAQVDYSNKMNENKRIEFGARSFYNNNTTHFATFSVDEANNETKLPLSNNYKYTETNYAGYFNYANKWKSITYQVGLRLEFSNFDGTLIDSNYHFGYTYPKGFKNLGYALFPSFFITQPLNENTDIQFNYSKRTRRPRFWEVDPFVDISDPLNIEKGNPGLHPEYTNSFELNYFNRFKNNGGSFLGVIYFKNNVGDITRYSDTITPELYDQLNNASISSDAILNTFINAGYTNRIGAELTITKKLDNKFDFTYNIDFQYRTTKASVNGIDLSNHGFNFDTKLIGNYKIITTAANNIFNNLSFQLTANYRGPQVTPQGKNKQQFVSDFALRKEFLKKKAASVSLSVNDIFNSRRFGNVYDTDDFYQDSYRRWSVRTFRISFTYKFGDNDFELFKKNDNNNNNNNNQENQDQQSGLNG